jgi:hypothetical protein
MNQVIESRGRARKAGALGLLAALLLSGGCFSTTTPGPGPGTPNIGGAWDWEVQYEDGDFVDFTMFLTEVDNNEYRAVVDGDDVGRVFISGDQVTWLWNRDNGVSRADGIYQELSSFDARIVGSGFDSFDDGSPRADFDFIAEQR